MSYWKKKDLSTKTFQCLGTTSTDKRCKNKLLFSTSTDKQVLCHLHKSQVIKYKHSSDNNKIKDVCQIIAGYIHDPKSYYSFSLTCLSSAKACQNLRLQKMKEFRKPYRFLCRKTKKFSNVFTLPNGIIVDKNFNIIYTPPSKNKWIL